MSTTYEQFLNFWSLSHILWLNHFINQSNDTLIKYSTPYPLKQYMKH